MVWYLICKDGLVTGLSCSILLSTSREADVVLWGFPCWILGDLHLNSSFRDHFLRHDDFRCLHRNLEIGHLQPLASSWSGLSSLVRLPDNCSPDSVKKNGRNTLAEISEPTKLLRQQNQCCSASLSSGMAYCPVMTRTWPFTAPGFSEQTYYSYYYSWEGPTCNLSLFKWGFNWEMLPSVLSSLLKGKAKNQF